MDQTLYTGGLATVTGKKPGLDMEFTEKRRKKNEKNNTYTRPFTRNPLGAILYIAWFKSWWFGCFTTSIIWQLYSIVNPVMLLGFVLSGCVVLSSMSADGTMHETMYSFACEHHWSNTSGERQQQLYSRVKKKVRKLFSFLFIYICFFSIVALLKSHRENSRETNTQRERKKE